MPGNNSGRRQPSNSAVPSTVGRLGVDGFWVGDYGGGGPGRPPCWRTLKESCKGLGSVSLKINNQHTHYRDAGSGISTAAGMPVPRTLVVSHRPPLSSCSARAQHSTRSCSNKHHLLRHIF